MPGLGGNGNQTKTTPGRRTYVRFDIPEFTAQEHPFQLARDRHEICRAGFGQGSFNVERNGAGGIQLAIIQRQRSQMMERNDPNVLRLQQWTTVPEVKERPFWRPQTELPGIQYNPGVSGGSSMLMTIAPAAGQSWANTLAAEEAANPRPDFWLPNLNLRRFAVTKQPIGPNRGAVFTWTVPRASILTPDYAAGWQFGAPVSPYDYGTFYFLFRGDGYFLVWQRQQEPGGTPSWSNIGEYRYHDVFPAMDTTFTMLVVPILHPSGRAWLQCEVTWTALPAQMTGWGPAFQSAGAGARAPFDGSRVMVEIPPPPLGGRLAATGPGTIHLDNRPDHRILTQITLVGYQATGKCVDQGFVLPFNASRRTPMTLRWVATVPANSAVEGRILDAETNSELEETSAGPNWRQYRINQGKGAYYAVFEFSGDGVSTPILWSYDVLKKGWIERSEPGEWEASTVRQVSISGAEWDASHETASLDIADPTNDLTKLRLRASIPMQIETRYDPEDPAKRSVLFRGYVQRATATRIGSGGTSQGLGGAGTGRLYPSPQWHNFQLSATGHWMRLKELRVPWRFIFGQADPEIEPNPPPTPGGGKPPWKVTDAVRFLLNMAGYPLSMIDVPDAPMRLWPSPQSDTSAMMLNPLADVAEFLQKILREYLGWALCWDPNAGVEGMWRAIKAKRAPYSPIAHFVLGPSGPGLPNHPATYGTTGYWSDGSSPVMAFVRKGTLQTWVRPPEANCVLVSTTGNFDDRKRSGESDVQYVDTACNPLSYNFFSDANGNTIQTADPNHPDYLGRCVPIFVVMPSLASDYRTTGIHPTTVLRWYLRRMFEVTCHAVKCATFEAPLLLVTDPADTLQRNPRPLRFYDAITLDGSVYLVRSCSPKITKDAHQMAVYEVEGPRF